jgi:hypothetical protein
MVVSQSVYEGLCFVRDSGKYNMFDRASVAKYARKKGYSATYIWIIDHPKDYATGIFEGFEVKKES